MPVGIVVVIALVVSYSQFGSKVLRYVPTKTGEKVVTEITPPAATGNIDDLVKALLQDTSNEALGAEEESNDAALIAADSQEISDFGQSYDENKF